MKKIAEYIGTEFRIDHNSLRSLPNEEYKAFKHNVFIVGEKLKRFGYELMSENDMMRAQMIFAIKRG